ncbi:hypothetical protein [Bradyrhizobium barranii]
MEKGLSASPVPIANQAKEFCGYMQRNATATFDLGEKLVQARDMQDALVIQSDFLLDVVARRSDQEHRLVRDEGGDGGH